MSSGLPPFVMSSGVEESPLTKDILVVVPLAQFFQPDAQALHVLNRLMTGDVIHFGMTPASGELPERKVLGEFCITIQLYYLFHLMFNL